jgi:hypothetical protein
MVALFLNVTWNSLYGQDPILVLPRSQIEGRPYKYVLSRFALTSLTVLSVWRTDFTIPVRAVRLSAGAGFLYPILGVSSCKRNLTCHLIPSLRICKPCQDSAHDQDSGRSIWTRKAVFLGCFSPQVDNDIHNGMGQPLGLLL